MVSLVTAHEKKMADAHAVVTSSGRIAPKVGDREFWTSFIPSDTDPDDMTCT